jgi:MFS transporter, NHS family, xanthosine permease
MNVKQRLIVLNFLQFFIWGSWLISLGSYMFTSFFATEGEGLGAKIGDTYATMGWASLFMPAIMGIIADKYLNAEKVLGLCHIIGGIFIYYAGTVTNTHDMYWAIFLTSCFYMPTIALNNSVSYNALDKNNFDIQKSFAPIRVWGTVGFVIAMWAIDFLGFTKNNNQFTFAAIAAIATGIYSFTLPKCVPLKASENKSFASKFGLDALVLLKQKKMILFFLFAMLLGAALQITNMFGSPFIDDFGKIDIYKDTFGVKHPNLLISISQISETLFILTIPFFLKRFGIKNVMLFSMLAWVLRFGLFGIGNPGSGLILLVLSMIVYGMAFDFFNISGSLFVEKEADVKIRSSAQGLFMLVTNGLGAILGGFFAGRIVDYFTNNGIKNWQNIWFTFAVYSLVIAVAFLAFFKYKHNPNETLAVKH